jgi:hypothetical protein
VRNHRAAVEADLCPILVVDVSGFDRRRIKCVLNDAGYDCLDEQAELIRQKLSPLPGEDRDLFAAVAEYIRIDYSRSRQNADTPLRRLAAEWEESPTGQRLAIELRMLIATADLDAHPEWWELPCSCRECKSAAT